MTETNSSYRPHDSGHDYCAPGIYLVTLVARNRRENARMFGVLNNDAHNPGVLLNDVGRAVMDCWASIPAFEESKGRKVVLHAAVCMPDHFHGVIEVKERMTVSLGQVIWGFKVACTKRWRQLQQPRTAAECGRRLQQPRTAAECGQPRTAAECERPRTTAECGQPSLAVLHRMSRKQRAEYYAQQHGAQLPLWDDNYDDTICLNEPSDGTYSNRHFNAMVRYVNDNARRAIIRRMQPTFMQRCLHVRIGDRDYAAFGNLFLLRWARKVQVMCHRKACFGMLTSEERHAAGIRYEALAEMKTEVPYEQTEAYRKECEEWEALVMAGQTVIVTPGISRGELLFKDKCIEKGLPMIHLQREPIGEYWKPEEKRFNACARGRLLILAPWKSDALGEVNGVPSKADYSVFHNLNKLAEEICLFDGDAVILA